MTQKQTSHKHSRSLSERVEHRQFLRRRIAEIQGSEIGLAHENLQALQASVGRAQVESSRYIKSLGGEGAKADWEESEKGRLSWLHEAENKAEAACKAAGEHFNQLTKELKTLENSYRQALDGTSVDEVIQHQDAIAEAENKVSEIETLIKQQEEVICEIGQGCPQTSDILQEREDILADLASGVESSKKAAAMDKIATLDKQVNEAKKVTSDASQILNDAEQTIRGLQRRLLSAQTHLNELNNLTPDVMVFYLTSEAEKVGEEYILNANNLVANYVRLMALNGMLKLYGEGSIGSLYNEMMIPLFRLKSGEKKVQHPTGRGYYFKSSLYNALQDAVEAEKARLASNGVTL